VAFSVPETTTLKTAYHRWLFCTGKNLMTLLPGPYDELLFRLALLAKLAMVDMKVAVEAILTDVLTGA
jgi:hypothetical protein